MKSLLCSLAVLMIAALAQGAEPAVTRSFLCCDLNGNQVCIVGADGKIEWRMEAKKPQECWKLPNGNILYCDWTGAIEATMEKKIVWQYKAPPEAECHSCQPLPDGRVLVSECGTKRLVEVDTKGEVVKVIPLATRTTKMHAQFRGARKTADGHYLVCSKGDKEVLELDGDGKVLKTIVVPGEPHVALRLPNANLLITCGDGHTVVEVDPEGKTVWTLNENDVPGNPLRMAAGIQRLPNGNTLISNYLGHGFIGKQPQAFEMTPDKKVVWEFADHKNFKTLYHVQALDVPGNAIKGELLK